MLSRHGATRAWSAATKAERERIAERFDSEHFKDATFSGDEVASQIRNDAIREQA